MVVDGGGFLGICRLGVQKVDLVSVCVLGLFLCGRAVCSCPLGPCAPIIGVTGLYRCLAVLVLSLLAVVWPRFSVLGLVPSALLWLRDLFPCCVMRDDG